MVTLSWVGPSLARDAACLTSVVTPFFPFSGKAPGRQEYSSISEPTWITEVKEKQKSSQALLPRKELRTKNRAAIKEPLRAVGHAAAHRTLPKGVRTG